MNAETITNKIKKKLVKPWEKVMVKHLESVGFKKDEQIIDFGCGDGKYTAFIAHMLSNKGKVFAVDQDKSKLEILERRAEELGVSKRVKIIPTKGKLKIKIKTNSIDSVLLYSVACCIQGKDNDDEFIELLKEFHRVTKKTGRLIIAVTGKTMEKRIDRISPRIKEQFKLDIKENQKYQFAKKNRNSFFYYFKKIAN